MKSNEYAIECVSSSCVSYQLVTKISSVSNNQFVLDEKTMLKHVLFEGPEAMAPPFPILGGARKGISLIVKFS